LIRLLHTADWHLGFAFGSFGETAGRRREDQRRAIDRTISLAIDERVDAALLCGDLFDSTRPDAAALAFARQALDRLAEKKIPAFAIAGTHDHLGVESARPLLVHDNLHWFDRPGCARPVRLACAGDDLWLYGLSAPAGRPAELESLRRRPGGGVHVGMLHPTLLPQEGLHVAYKDLPVTPAQLAALNLDYFALGHFHDFREIRAGGRLLGAYCGTPEGLRFGEAGPRYALLVEFGPAGATVRAQPVGEGLCVEQTLDVAGAADDEALVRLLARCGGANVYARLRLSGLLDEPLDLDSLRAQAAPQFAYLELLDETDLSGSLRLRDVAREPSVRGRAIGGLLRKLDAETDAQRRRVLQRALAHLALEFERHQLRL